MAYSRNEQVVFKVFASMVFRLLHAIRINAIIKKKKKNGKTIGYVSADTYIQTNHSCMYTQMTGIKCFSAQHNARRAEKERNATKFKFVLIKLSMCCCHHFHRLV